MPQNGLNPLPPHKAGDSPSASRFNKFEGRAITDITVGPGLTMQRVNGSVAIGRRNEFAPIHAVLRATVTQLNPVTQLDPNGDTSLVLARRFTDPADGDTFPVRKALNHAVGDQIYIFRPLGGVVGDPEYDPPDVGGTVTPAVTVEWQELAEPVIRAKVTGAILEGTPAIAVCEAFDGVETNGPAFPVALAAPHVVNSELYALRPLGGVIHNPTYLTAPVLWQEIARLPEGEIQHQLLGNVVQNGLGFELPLGTPDLLEVQP